MRILQILALMLCLTVLVNGQKTKFCGVITDELGAIIPSVVIEGKSTKAEKFKTTANSEGKFEIEVVEGIYKILIRAESFKKTILRNQKLPLERQKCVEIKLRSAVPPHQIT